MGLMKSGAVVAAMFTLVACGSERTTMSGGGTGGVGAIGGASGAGAVGGVGGTAGTAGTGGTAGVGGGGDTLEGRFPEVTDWNALEIVFPTMYSGYDGQHTFKVPVRVRCTSVPLSAWKAEPASAVTFDADPDNADGAMITILQPVASIRIAAVTGSLGGIAPLSVTIGTPEQYALGETRYNTGADWMLNILMPSAPPPDTKCTVCHSENSSAGFDIEHTPTQLARASDASITQIMTTGTKPADVPFRVLPDTITFVGMTFTNAELYEMFHLWEASQDALTGMILYLRALTPRGQGCVTDPSDGVCKEVEEADPACM